MAIAHGHVSFLIEFRRINILGGGKTRSILELGEQNWFGDISSNALFGIIDNSALPEEKKISLHNDLSRILNERQRFMLFDIAKIFYSVIFEYEKYVAIDLHGTPAAKKLDLNRPLPFTDRFDVVTNIGTSEHVFNQYQVFKTIHDHVRPAGLMIHALPNQGLYDHGLYNYHPTFIFDLCEENGYQIISLALTEGSKIPRLIELHGRVDYVQLAVDGKLPTHSGLMAILRQSETIREFRVPRQGYYGDKLPEELAEAWSRLPRGGYDG